MSAAESEGDVKISRVDAAIGQLETAIELWFYERDVASIHTLAVAAQGVLSSLAREMKVKPRTTMDVINSLSKRSQEVFRNPQNFFKHGHHKERSTKGYVVYTPEMAEVFMIDAVVTCSRMFGRLSPVMFLFVLRYCLSNPKELLTDDVKAVALKGAKIEDFRGLGRVEFFEKVLPLLT